MQNQANIRNPKGLFEKNNVVAILNFLIFLFPYFALLTVCICVFKNHWFMSETFIGDSDRLNTFLNIRKFEVDSIQALNSVPAWNENMFMGFSMYGLHWMLPGLDPAVWLLSYFPIDKLYWLAGCVSSFWYALAAVASFIFINDTVKAKFPAFVCALLYVFSTFSLTRIGQVDSAYWIMILMPLGMVSLRHIQGEKFIRCFLFFSLISIVLLFTFLQEAAYTFFLFGCYALYRGITLRKWKILWLSGLAVLLACLIASPRIITVFNEFSGLERTNDFHQTGFHEFFRWVYDGIYGRYPGELFTHGIGLNLHEGFQVYTSTLVVFLFCWGMLRVGSRIEILGAILCFYVMSFVFRPWILLSYKTKFIYLVLVIAICYFQKKLRFDKGGCEKLLIKSEDVDVAFHIFFFIMCFSIIFIPHARRLLYVMFFKIDFTHSRLSLVALLPLMTLTAYFLKNLFGKVEDGKFLNAKNLLISFLILSAGLIIAYLVQRPLESPDYFYRWENFFSDLNISNIRVVPTAFIHIIISFLIFLILVVFYFLYKSKQQYQKYTTLLLGILMLGEGFQYASFQLGGGQTHTYPIPFGNNNFMLTTVDKGFIPPSFTNRQQLRKKLETDSYRSILIADPKKFPAFVAPHLSQYWSLRVIEGYSAGVPQRLAEFPWTNEVRNLRSLSFPSISHINWPLLSLLNVKYAIVVTPEFYHNENEFNSDKMLFFENPYKPVPRVFFARNIEAIEPNWNIDSPMLPKKIILQSLNESSILLTWGGRTWVSKDRVHIDRKEGENGVFQEIAVVGSSGNYLNKDLEPSTKYYFRLKVCFDKTCSHYSSIQETKTSALGKHKPKNIRIERSFQNVILKWHEVASEIFTLIEVRKDADGNYSELLRTNPGDPSAVVSDLLPNQAYFFRIRNCDNLGCSPHSEEVEYYHDNNSALKLKDELLKEPITTRRGIVIPKNVVETSLVEGLSSHADFDTIGKIDVVFKNDWIGIQFEPSLDRERFLVINELYHKDWQAFDGKQELKIYPTNLVMRGVLIPPNVSKIILKFRPFIISRLGLVISITGFSILVFVVGILLYRQHKRRKK